jgi:hypothetical protein
MRDDILLPAFFTKPLSEEFSSAGPKLRSVFEQVWRDPQTGGLTKLDAWQAWLIDHILETYPPGHPLAGQLRYRRVVCLIPRQQGKSLIGACLTFYFMFMHVPTPQVVGAAGRNATQASIVYSRLREAIIASPLLMKEFRRKPTAKHMTLRTGGTYQIFPANSDAIQGQPITGGMLDEIHLMKREVWDAMTIGQRSQPRSMLVGISTAGDTEAALVNTLTEEGRELSTKDDPDSRFGYFEWTCPKEIPWNSEEAVLSCNPGVVSGRIPLEEILSTQSTMLESDYRLYTLNQTMGSAKMLVEAMTWARAGRKWAQLPNGLKPIAAHCEITPSSNYATITLAAVDDSGNVHTRMDCSIPSPANSYLATILHSLVDAYPGLVISLDGYDGKDIAQRLSEEGVAARMFNLGDIARATAWFADRVKKKALFHDNESIYKLQLQKALVRRLPKGGYRIVPAKDCEIDAIHSLIMAAYSAQKIADEGPPNIGLFIF